MRFFLLLCSLIAAFKTSAQQYSYWQLNDKQGLPSNTVYQIIESDKGIIYLGTAAGLVRFNGFTFETIPNPEAQSTDVSDLQISPTGEIYFSNFNYEIFSYQPETNKIFKLPDINADNFNSQGKYLLRNNKIYTYSGKKLFEYDLKKKKNRNIYENYSSIFQIQIEGDNLYFLDQNIFKYNLITGTVSIVSKNNPKSDNTKHKIYFLRKSQNFFTTIINLEENREMECKIDLFKYPGIPTVNNCSVLRDSSIWVCTNNGATIFSSNGKPISETPILEGKNISYAYKDKKGNTWISTLDEGLFMTTGLTASNYVFYKENHNPNPISRFYVTRESLYIGFANGEIKSKKHLLGFQSLSIGDKKNIYLINRLSDGSFIVNSNYFPLNDNKPRFIAALSAPKCIIETDNYIYFSNNVGFNRASKKGLPSGTILPEKTRFNFIELSEEGHKKSEKTIWCAQNIIDGRSNTCYLDKNNNIWISSVRGIYSLNTQTNTIIKYSFCGSGANPAAEFCEDNNGNIYIAITNIGIVKVRNGQCEMLFNSINSSLDLGFKRMILVDLHLWVTTRSGLYKISLQDKSIHAFQISDGLFSNDINDIAYFENKIWIATNDGINTISKDFLPLNPHAPEIYLKSIIINDKNIAYKGQKEINLNYKENNLLISFEGINYKSRNLLHYKYRLTGQSNDWIDLPGSQNRLIFQGLPIGKYTLEIIAYNDKNIPSKALIVKFNIKRPFWLTWWFWSVLFIALCLTLFLIYRSRQIEKERNKQLQSDLRISQLSSLKAQMNPHFMFNSLNSIQDFILLNDKKSANAYLGKFSDLMRMVLEMSNKNLVNLSTEINALNLYLELEALRFEDTFEYSFKIDESIEVGDWKLPSMIIQPFIENAVKHGLLHKLTDRKLSVEINKVQDENLITVTITDNGIGRKASAELNRNRQKKYASFATGATEERLRILNKEFNDKIKVEIQDLENSHHKPIGTRVVLTIPITEI